MNSTNSDDFFRRANGSAADKSGDLKAIVVEEPDLVRRMLEESGSSICNRCHDPRRSVVGIAFFRSHLPNLLRHLGRSDWALCSTCLNSLKEHGYPELGDGGGQRN
jgi:hypothetical protein